MERHTCQTMLLTAHKRDNNVDYGRVIICSKDFNTEVIRHWYLIVIYSLYPINAFETERYVLLS